MAIIKREIVKEINKYINTDNIIVLHGSRQVGKTHIMYFLENSLKDKKELTHYIDLEDGRKVELLNRGIDEFLLYLEGEFGDLKKIESKGKKIYVFIDEIQYLENPSPLMKLIIDHHKYIQLIVSGSSSFAIKSKFSDSLVGRTVDFEVFNLSFKEFLNFKGLKYNLEKISHFHTEKINRLYREYIRYGAYPKIVLEDSIEKKEKYLQQIIDTYVKKDIRDLANIKDLKKFNDLLKILAKQSGQLLNVSSLANTINLAKQTVEKYLFILENTYIIKLVPPFSTNPKVEVAKAQKIFFYDTGLLQMLWLDSTVGENVGNVFETSIFSKLVKKYSFDNVKYWRNKNQNEVDFIIDEGNAILPIEVKESFQNFRKSSIESFLEKYKIKKYKVVSLSGEKMDESCVYPWEL